MDEESDTKSKVTISDLAEKAATKEPEPKPKKRIGLGIMLTVLVLLLVGGALAAGYLWGNNTVKPANNTGTNNSTSNSNTDEETELTDATLKKDISNKVATLHGRKSDDGAINLSSFTTGPLGPIVYKELSSEDKLRFVLDLILSNGSYNTISQDERALVESLIAGDPLKYVGLSVNNSANYDYYSNIKSLPIETVKTKYYDLFGEDPEILKETRGRIVEACSLYVYSEENNSYIHFSPSGCGSPAAGLGSEKFFYVYDYTSLSNNIYVYIAAGSAGVNFTQNASGVQQVDSYFVSVGLDENSPIYKKLTDGEEGYDFQIDESNYQDFSKYRLVFERNDKGTYSFKRAEKIE
ncbi:hypothetical protein IKF27_01435 [Candidatus Saccharibacteria bacterium]|nr:hypothetical protein [Candidatus Saccharibacteria bacterium]